jgi:hypothetical protein
LETDRVVSQAGRSDSKLGAQMKLLERMQTLQAMLNTQKARRQIVAIVKQVKAEWGQCFWRSLKTRSGTN